jgi:CheY-like chemotaxis protein
MRNSRPVLLVEDDTIDALTVKRSFGELGLTCPLLHRVNGEDALTYLTEAGHELPCIILLDLNMPKMNGIEFLRIAKNDPALKAIPVVVLTTSNEEQDIAETFRLSVAGYLVKPVDYSQFMSAMRTVDLYWTLSELPTDHAQSQFAACEASSARGN